MKSKINPLTVLFLGGLFVTLGLTYTDFSGDEILLFLGYNRQIKLSFYLLRWMVLVYFLILIFLSSQLSGSHFKNSRVGIWFYILFLVLPLMLFILVAVNLEWFVSLLGNYRGGYCMSFSDYIYDYFIFNIVLALLNILGIAVLVVNLIKGRFAIDQN
jgi:hypothetical protein